MKTAALLVLRAYRAVVSPLLPTSCRYFPTCSQYAYEAIEKHGLLRGSRLAALRIFRCHPGHPGGVDPVP
jgi:putative membrane protein insertion efficiency factor